MRCRSALALWIALSLILAGRGPAARADAIRLEPLLRVITRDPAWAVAVDERRQRLLVAEGEYVREYVPLSADVVVPAMSQAAHLLGRAVDMVVDGADVYVATQRGVCRFDPRKPSVVVCRAGFSASGLAVVGEQVYVAAADRDHNECGLWVLDRALLLQSKWVDHCWCGDLIQGFSDVAVEGSHAYVAVWAGGGFTGYLDGAVGVLDVSRPADPHWSGVSGPLPGLPSRIVLSDGRAYVAQDTDGYTPHLRPGLTVLDLRAGDTPRLAGQLDMAGDVTSLALAAPYALVGDANGRVWAIDISAAGDPRVAAWLDTPFEAHDVAVSGAEVYVAEGQGGLVALQMVPVAEPTPTPRLQTAEGTLTRVDFSICQAGETHSLAESGVYLYSDFVKLQSFERRYVRVWGWEVESPECRLLNVIEITLVAPTPTERPTPTDRAMPTMPQPAIYLPVVRKMM
jgi:hypothetical protein